MVTGVFCMCVVSYAVAYAPWDRPLPIYRDRRNRLASVWVAGGAGFFMVFAILHALLFPDRGWHLSVAGAAMLGLVVWRAACEMTYQATGRVRALGWMV